MSYLERAVADGHCQIVGDGPKRRIVYSAANYSDRLDDPEELVRAEYWAELIYRYDYEPQRIGVEITVPDRTPKDAADIVIFEDDRRTRPFAVVECKREEISDAEFAQAVEQAAGNGTWAKFRVPYVGVVAGPTRRFLDFGDTYGPLERENNIIADLPRAYGKPLEFKYTKAGPLDIRPVNKEELIGALGKCHQTLWGGGRLSPPAAFSELCKLIFVKIQDERVPRRRGQPYEFQIRTHESSRQLGERVRALYKQQQEQDRDVFSESLKVSDAELRTIVSHLEAIDLGRTDIDVKGLAFEQFMDGFFKGDFGQYFTPREVIDFAVQMLEPKRTDKVIDPACGSAGFLLHALEWVRRDASTYYAEGTEEHFRHWGEFANTRLYGIEINGEIARVAKMNMILHGDGHTNIVGADALEPEEKIRALNPGLKFGEFDLVLTNPPFGAQVLLSEHPYLGAFFLGTQERGNRRVPRTSQKTEILFLERISELLKPGVGRAAVVVPDGILTNRSLQYVRDYILEKFALSAVVSLPGTAFSYYGAGVKSSVLFLRRLAPSEVVDDDQLVFMAAPDGIGYDATGRTADNHLPRVVEDFHAFQVRPEDFAQ